MKKPSSCKLISDYEHKFYIGVSMRKIVVMNRISIDGYFAGQNGEIDWFGHDPAVEEATHQMMSPDTLLMGRLTYQMFNHYWVPVGNDPNSPEGLMKIANELNRMQKVVFSTTLEAVDWVNSQLVKNGVEDAVRQVKASQGGDITIFGSGSIVNLLAKANLIDEYILIVSPTILGAGKSMFGGVERTSFDLLDIRQFESGHAILHYRKSV